MTSQALSKVIETRVQFDHNTDFPAQVQKLVSSIELTSEQWQTEPLLIVLPGHSAIAAVLLAEIHGRIGYFPSCIRLRPIQDASPPEFEVAEILNLQTLRDAARQIR